MTEVLLVKSDKTVPRLGASIREAARSLNVSEKHFREELMPLIPHVRAGRRVIIPLDSLRQFLAEHARCG